MENNVNIQEIWLYFVLFVVVFPQWGGLCDYGRHQSPIDLSTSGALKGIFPEFDFHNYDKNLDKPLLLNNGHTGKKSYKG